MPGTYVSHMEAYPVSQPPGEAEQTASALGKLLKAVQDQARFPWADSACSVFARECIPSTPVQKRFAAQSTGAMI